ncbi:hypothetical protein [Polaribacter butkevichii]|uniref:DUF3592 domain-containing protein n=1 Tax=Polaribacter butkevichii TaxID=218490 RepID=A0A2P6C6A5_9FLAO|nr:hypothetical protein [Polaribacter butkevichii]PQJ65919.1 hypothetical protein BTO14_16970 [Polaribacter butkevichii]
MSDNKKPFFFILSVLLIICYTIFEKNSYHKEIIDNKKTVIGKVTEYQFSEYDYLLTYEYEVNEVKYKNVISTSFFKCKDGIRGCVGKAFNVSYSSINPKKSDINLEEYNKFKD